MTDEQYIELTEYETQLSSAAYGNFVRFVTLERKKRLSQLYSEIFNKKSKMLNGCGTCALREMKELGLLYFAEKEAREIRDREGLEQNEETKTEEVEVQTVTKNKTVKRSQKKKE
jgi:hypothetical protein